MTSNSFGLAARLGRLAPSIARSDEALELQRIAGNRATRSLLAPATPAPQSRDLVVSRYETGEHVLLGGNRAVMIGGMRVTEGELISLGDFFATPDDVFREEPARLRRLLVLVRRDREHFAGTPGVEEVSTEEWQEATDGRYLELAAANEAHFAPGGHSGSTSRHSAPGASHWGAWRRFHVQALNLAHRHAATDQQVPPEALARNAFAGHYLTDAFSAGHIVAKREIMDRAQRRFAALRTTGTIFQENVFTQEVARRVLADSGVRERIAGQQLRLVAWGDFTVTRFSELLWQIQRTEPDTFFNGFAKVVHDQLNELILADGDDAGLEVSNRRGETWRLSGDGTLARSPDTRRIAQAAMEESHRNLVEAATTTGDLDYQALFSRVWDYTPQPTTVGESQIAHIMQVFTDPSNVATIQAFAALAISEIDTALAALREQNRVRPRPQPRPREREPLYVCFTADTLITLASGATRPIASIGVGDEVLGYDTTRARITVARVTGVHRHPPKPVMALEITGAGVTRLRATEEHPFWSEDRHAWIAARTLRQGERLVAVGPGRTTTVAKVHRIARRVGCEEVYNLTVSGEHDYFAGDVLVHNKP